jgi:ESCRT-II complex subunit VPS25
MAETELPEFYHFPPFFTLQPVLETRRMQLKLWHDFVIRWHQVREALTLVSQALVRPLYQFASAGTLVAVWMCLFSKRP